MKNYFRNGGVFRMEKTELKPVYDRRKSFYKKAFVIREYDGTIKLLAIQPLWQL